MHESKEDIARVGRKLQNLREQTNAIIEELVLQQDKICEENNKTRDHAEAAKNKIVETEDMLIKNKEECQKLQLEACDVIRKLVAERNENIEERRKYDADYAESQTRLKEVENTLIYMKDDEKLKENITYDQPSDSRKLENLWY